MAITNLQKDKRNLTNMLGVLEVDALDTNYSMENNYVMYHGFRKLYIDLDNVNFVNGKAFALAVTDNGNNYLTAVRFISDNNYDVILLARIKSGRKLTDRFDSLSSYDYLDSNSVIARSFFYKNKYLHGNEFVELYRVIALEDVELKSANGQVVYSN